MQKNFEQLALSILTQIYEQNNNVDEIKYPTQGRYFSHIKTLNTKNTNNLNKPV